jgi:hypothetical protein
VDQEICRYLSLPQEPGLQDRVPVEAAFPQGSGFYVSLFFFLPEPSVQCSSVPLALFLFTLLPAKRQPYPITKRWLTSFSLYRLDENMQINSAFNEHILHTCELHKILEMEGA